MDVRDVVEMRWLVYTKRVLTAPSSWCFQKEDPTCLLPLTLACYTSERSGGKEVAQARVDYSKRGSRTYKPGPGRTPGINFAETGSTHATRRGPALPPAGKSNNQVETRE